MQPETLLHRQIPSVWVQEDRPTSQAFRPTEKDEGLLSTYDGDQISAPLSWRHYTVVLSLESYGVCSIAVAECSGLNLPVRPDPDEFPEHVVVDFTTLGRSEMDRKAKKLRDRATVRGWQHRASSTPAEAAATPPQPQPGA